jgi:hypothetical protein
MFISQLTDRRIDATVAAISSDKHASRAMNPDKQRTTPHPGRNWNYDDVSSDHDRDTSTPSSDRGMRCVLTA